MSRAHVGTERSEALIPNIIAGTAKTLRSSRVNRLLGYGIWKFLELNCFSLVTFVAKRRICFIRIWQSKCSYLIRRAIRYCVRISFNNAQDLIKPILNQAIVLILKAQSCVPINPQKIRGPELIIVGRLYRKLKKATAKLEHGISGRPKRKLRLTNTFMSFSFCQPWGHLFCCRYVTAKCCQIPITW